MFIVIEQPDPPVDLDEVFRMADEILGNAISGSKSHPRGVGEFTKIELSFCLV